jgi:hypothetical protein
VPNSQVPTGLLPGPPSGGALLLTSGRALFYRPDLTPTSDTTWTSGTTSNAGRNYGYALSFSHGSERYASLIGGCSVRAARMAMKTGQLPSGRQGTSLGGVDAHCGIHRHYEWFRLQGTSIVQHVNHYYSYSFSDGFFHNRPEFPGNAIGPIGGAGTMWTAYNVFDAPLGSQGAGQWRIEMRPNPADPRVVVQKPGWFVWDVVDLNADGKAELLATRADPQSAKPYILPWEFDVLVWNGRDLVSVHHRGGVVPSLFRYVSGATRYSSSAREGTLTGPVSNGVKLLMVEDREGRRTFLSVPRQAFTR